MSDLLRDRIAVITGAGSGVGRASALAFAREGASVVCADIRPEWGEETVRLVDKEGGSASFVACDVTREEQVQALIEAAVAAHDRIDVMFNNAGVATPRPGMSVEEHDERDFDYLTAINFKGVFFGCKYAVRQLKAQSEGGVIINTGSAAGMVGWGGVVYGATKAAVIQLTRSLAMEVAEHGIRVNTFCPGGIDTNFAVPEEAAFRPKPAEALEALGSLHPLGRPITAEDCANAALFLASDLSSNITGAAIPVDGGYTAR